MDVQKRLAELKTAMETAQARRAASQQTFEEASNRYSEDVAAEKEATRTFNEMQQAIGSAG